MDTLLNGLDALWRVALVALVIGVGLPTLFAVAMRLLQHDRTIVSVAGDGSGVVTKASALGRIGATACIAILIAAVAFGIVVIVFGKRIFGA